MALSPEQIEQIRKRFLDQIEQLPAEQNDYKAQLRQQIMNASPDQLEAAIKPQEGKETECIFCSIVKGEVDAIKVYEDDSVTAFLDINPAAPGQVIVVPKEHVQFIFQMSDQVLWSLIKTVKLLEPFIVTATKAKGLSIYISQGNAAGQFFKHLAVYMIPRFEEDKANFSWPRNEAKKEDLEAVARNIKDGMDNVIREEKEKIQNTLKEKMKVQDSKPETLEELPPRRM